MYELGVSGILYQDSDGQIGTAIVIKFSGMISLDKKNNAFQAGICKTFESQVYRFTDTSGQSLNSAIASKSSELDCWESPLLERKK